VAGKRDKPGDEGLLDRFANLNIWRRGDERAPHKPLLILFALARLQRGEPRLVLFQELDEHLKKLLAEFGPPRKSFHPEYPFWHLQSDGLWEIPQIDELNADLGERSRKNNPPKSVLIRSGAEGGLPRELDATLRSRPDLVNRIAARLLEDHWEPSFHDDILDAVGMPYVQVTRRRPRDPAFRDTILRIYQHRCAVCGYDALLGTTDLGIEAAHIHWHCHGGPDTEENGLALCANHHKAFDRGALGLDDDHRILVSQHLRDTEGARDWLIRFAGQPIRGPQPGCPHPAPRHLEWHRTEVFREPARETLSPEVPT
jgi:putative restriction endonuclease